MRLSDGALASLTVDAPFRERLLALRADAAVKKALSVSRTLPEGMRRAMIGFHLEQQATPNAELARFFILDERLARPPAGVPDALVVPGDGFVLPALVLSPASDSIALYDPRDGDGVHAPRIDASRVPSVERTFQTSLHVGGDALDLTAARRWSIEERPRARLLARLNAALLGLTVESSPPPESVDRLAIDATRVEDVSRHLPRLARGGVATVVLETREDASFDVPSDARALFLRMPTLSPDDWCATEAAARYPELGPRYEARFDELRREIVNDTTRTVAVIVRDGKPWQVTRTLAHLGDLDVARAFAAIDLAHADASEVFAAKVSVRAGTRIASGAPEERLIPLHNASSVGDFIVAAGGPKLASQLLPAVRSALIDGTLEAG